MCRVCGKSSHTTLNCWHRFDHSYQASQQLPSTYVAAPNPEFDPQWYADIGATHHLTNELQNMILHAESYKVKIRFKLGMVQVCL